MPPSLFNLCPSFDSCMKNRTLSCCIHNSDIVEIHIRKDVADELEDYLIKKYGRRKTADLLHSSKSASK